MDRPAEREPSRILVVDDDSAIRQALRLGIERAGMRCETAESGEQALAVLKRERFDVVVTDIRMPGLSGVDLCTRVRQDYDADVIVMTGMAYDVAYAEMIARGAADFILKPLQLPEFVARLQRVLWGRETLQERNRALDEAQDTLVQLRRALEGTVRAISRVVEMKDPYTAGHQLRVADVACAIGREMGLDPARLEGLRVAATLHDVGKITVPTEILNRPGSLTTLERLLVKEHVAAGLEILRSIEFPWPVAAIISQHHERLNGTGYPLGLAGHDILLEARILAVSDVFESMSSHRPYRPARGLEAATEELVSHSGDLYDAAVVDTCLRLQRGDGLGQPTVTT